jgi:FlaA1/EpsC-like NDP-sugar epimerase
MMVQMHPARIIRLRNRYLLLLDTLLVGCAPVIAYALRFESWSWSAADQRAAILYAAIALPLKLVTFHTFGLYRRLWRHASVEELERISLACLTAALLCTGIGAIVLPGTQLTEIRVPLSVLLLDAFITSAAAAAPRLFVRLASRRTRRSLNGDAKRVLIAGAGTAGQMIVKELLGNPQLGMCPVGFVDDDRRKHNHLLNDLRVFGPLSAIPELVGRHGIHTVIIAMPRAPGHVVRRVVRAASQAGADTRTVPGLFEIIAGRVGVKTLRDVEIQDLLRREPVRTDLKAVSSLATDQTVLVTGAGGSIGAELCRQLALLCPSQMIMLGHGENSIFESLQDLHEKFPGVTLIPVIADVRDRLRIREIFERFRPHAVFHAAAHKHVPLMEENVVEAVTNNVGGTKTVVDAALETDVRHLVFISTDKAVRPTSVMGATKRLAELLVQHAALSQQRNFVSVRFGNVLGSRGSVVPTFLRQIRAGGPVTVTHPEMCRYFMTIPEAVQLVLQAGAIGRGGEVFVLDMGDPVKIVDLAADLVRLSGLEVNVDIDLRFTGVRPGEKLHEEVLFSGENVAPTEHPKVLRARNEPLEPGVVYRISTLLDAADSGACADDLRRCISSLIPEMSRRPRTDHLIMPHYAAVGEKVVS